MNGRLAHSFHPGCAVYPSSQAASTNAGGSASAALEIALEPGPVLLGLIGAAILGMVATLLIIRRERKDVEATAPHDSQFAVSTEGEKRCPHCGMGNMWTDARCISCGKPLLG